MYYIRRIESNHVSPPHITWQVRTTNPKALYKKVIELDTYEDARVWLINYQSIVPITPLY